MQNSSSIDISKLRQTNRLVMLECQRRNWRVSMLHERYPVMWMTRDDGKQLAIYGSTPPTTSFVAAAIADSKLASYELLKDIPELRDLETIRLVGNETATLVKDFIAKHGRVVVKPIDGSHGNGITTNVTDEVSARSAIEYAKSSAKGSSIIMQAQYNHSQPHEVRVLCIDGAYVGAIYRQPARVLGDGVSTIDELIKKENEREMRGEPYVQLLAAIDEDQARAYLGDRINSVPKQGEYVNVLGIANYGTGGETIDTTDTLPEWLIDDALRIAERFNLPLIGVDFIMKAYPSPGASRDDLDAVVLEVNRSPSLAIHDQPTSGAPRPAVRAFVDYLAKL